MEKTKNEQEIKILIDLNKATKIKSESKIKQKEEEISKIKSE
jgi:hypothetical protein